MDGSMKEHLVFFKRNPACPIHVKTASKFWLFSSSFFPETNMLLRWEKLLKVKEQLM